MSWLFPKEKPIDYRNTWLGYRCPEGVGKIFILYKKSYLDGYFDIVNSANGVYALVEDASSYKKLWRFRDNGFYLFLSESIECPAEDFNSLKEFIDHVEEIKKGA